MTISKDRLGRLNTTRYTIAEELKIVEMYKNGLDTNSIAKLTGKKYNTSIRRVLIRYNIKLRPIGIAQQLVKNNPLLNQHYWLGFLCADGNVYKNRIKLALNVRDIDILNQLSQLTGANVLDEPKNCKSVAFNSKEIVDYLKSLGITPAKSLTLDYKGIITWDFIRGLIDGDGSIVKSTPIRIGIFSASVVFINQIYNFMLQENIKLQPPKIVNGLTYGLYINKTSDVLIVYAKLYYQKEIPFLERKKSKFGSLIQEWISKQTAKSANILKNAEQGGFNLSSVCRDSTRSTQNG